MGKGYLQKTTYRNGRSETGQLLCIEYSRLGGPLSE